MRLLSAPGRKIKRGADLCQKFLRKIVPVYGAASREETT